MGFKLFKEFYDKHNVYVRSAKRIKTNRPKWMRFNDGSKQDILMKFQTKIMDMVVSINGSWDMCQNLQFHDLLQV